MIDFLAQRYSISKKKAGKHTVIDFYKALYHQNLQNRRDTDLNKDPDLL